MKFTLYGGDGILIDRQILIDPAADLVTPATATVVRARGYIDGERGERLGRWDVLHFGCVLRRGFILSRPGLKLGYVNEFGTQSLWTIE
jgi:hypothetical protein